MHNEKLFIEFIDSLKHDRDLFLSGNLHNKETELLNNINKLQKYLPSIQDYYIKEKVDDFIKSVINSKNYLITKRYREETEILKEKQEIASQKRREEERKEFEKKRQLIRQDIILQEKLSSIISEIQNAINNKDLETAYNLFKNYSNDILNHNLNYYMDIFQKIDIMEVLVNRKIKKLIHFTNIQNLESILNLGIIPRDILNERHIEYRFTDDDRRDGRPDCTCLSVEYPNTQMLYNKKYNSTDIYVVIVLDAISILLNDIKKYYVYINAANSNAAYQLKNDNLTEIEHLKRMFNVRVKDKKRIYEREDKYPDFLTTHPQAEILVNGIIDDKDILEIHFSNIDDFNLFKNNCKDKQLLNEYKFIVSDFYFKEDRELVQWEER